MNKLFFLIHALGWRAAIAIGSTLTFFIVVCVKISPYIFALFR